MGNGVYDHAKRDISPAINSPKRGRSATAMYGKPEHKRVAKSLGFVLNQGKPSDWHGFTIILLARATEAEIAALAYSALQALSHNTGYMTASVALFGTLKGGGAWHDLSRLHPQTSTGRDRASAAPHADRGNNG
ncbi:MAG: hypothetical protein ACU0CA_10105 [Paracoccaceae bacterium]